MSVKLVVLMSIFILQLQIIDAKKKKKDPGVIENVSSFMSDMVGHMEDAWDAVVDLLPTPPPPANGEAEKTPGWSVTNALQYANKNFKQFYDRVFVYLNLNPQTKARSSEVDDRKLDVILEELIRFLTQAFSETDS
ncbi:hypothetical protein GWI33_023018 [Rhynchophorus ferrugineus]|uniref:Uncharacterized protein n=1 Tax=Rhynchophorus ferrugineus TaxID=354439 RepID=A0A834MIN8_RHYFE|nr:hypothetical protein GWI33_023018 [Rhynchophorus ferrugineus]